MPSSPPQPLPRISARAVDATTVVVSVEPMLSAPGAALLAEASLGGIYRFILVSRTGADTFSAVNGTCTHEGCTVSLWASPLFVCPCHGSRYTVAGEVVQGPAPAALPRFGTELRGGDLYITI